MVLILTCIARPMLTAGRAIIGVHAWDSVAKRETVNMMNRFHEISHTFRGASAEGLFRFPNFLSFGILDQLLPVPLCAFVSKIVVAHGGYPK